MIVFDLRAIDLMKIWRGATTHHSLLSLYSLQSLPLQAWHLCIMIKHQMWGFWSYFCQIFQENISPISMWQPRLAHGNTKWWWEKGGHPRQKPFYVGLKPQNTLAKTQSTFAKKTEHTCKKQTHLQKKTQNTFAKKCYTFAVFLKSLKRRQSWNEGGWIVRDHLQDTFGSFP